MQKHKSQTTKTCTLPLSYGIMPMDVLQMHSRILLISQYLSLIKRFKIIYKQLSHNFAVFNIAPMIFIIQNLRFQKTLYFTLSVYPYYTIRLSLFAQSRLPGKLKFSLSPDGYDIFLFKKFCILCAFSTVKKNKPSRKQIKRFLS